MKNFWDLEPAGRPLVSWFAEEGRRRQTVLALVLENLVQPQVPWHHAEKET
jgi:hypothetical protein